MIVFDPLSLAIVNALAADPDTFGGNQALRLSQTPFGSSNGTGFTECNFPGYGEIAGAWNPGLDPISQQGQLTLQPAGAGGFTFEANGSLVTPQPIAGYMVVNIDSNTPLGGMVFPQPITIAAPHQQFTQPAPIALLTPNALNGPQ